MSVVFTPIKYFNHDRDILMINLLLPWLVASLNCESFLPGYQLGYMYHLVRWSCCCNYLAGGFSPKDTFVIKKVFADVIKVLCLIRTEFWPLSRLHNYTSNAEKRMHPAYSHKVDYHCWGPIWVFGGNAFLVRVCVCLRVRLCFQDLLLRRLFDQAQIFYTRILDPRDVSDKKKIRNFSKL